MVLGLWWIWGCSGEVKPVEDEVKVKKGFKEYESEFYEGEKDKFEAMGVNGGGGFFK